MEEITVRNLDSSTLEGQVNLYNKVFQLSATKEFWDYKHNKNPLMKHYNVFGAFDGDKLIGINAFMPMIYNYKDTKIQALQSCESAVDSDYRGKGIFTKIIKTAEEYYAKEGYDLMIGFPNKNSYSAFMKMGWDCLCGLKVAHLPCKAVNFIHNRYKIPLFICKLFDIIPYMMLVRTRCNAKKSKGLAVEELPISQYSVDANCAVMNNENLIIFHKTKEILEWKLKSDQYKYYVVKKGTRTILNVIVRIYEDHNIKRSQIISVSGERVDEQTFISSLSSVCVCLSKIVDIIVCFLSETHDSLKLIKKCGFIKKGKPVPFIIKPLSVEGKHMTL